MTKQATRVIVVDDDRIVCDFLQSALAELGYQCTTVLSGSRALQELETQKYDVMLLDIRLPGMSGMDVLREIWLNHSNTATIMITGINDIDTAVESMKLGASDYIVKPLDLEKVANSIEAALKARQAAPKPSTKMEAIAHGVEARLDPSSILSKTVTQKSVEIAQRLGIAEEEIKQWAEVKSKLDSEKSKLFGSSAD